jgi:RpiB/LacA/LacB family sugar-phosphate isomerase
VRIYTGSDHAGFSLRNTLVERLRGQGKEVVDLGTDSETACDYPEFAYAVASKVRSDPGSLGILVCATGQGMAMAAGKVRGIRAAAPANIEAARLSRIDNNANVLCLAGRMLSESDAHAMVDAWLSTSFAGGRHARRIAKVAAIETASAVAFVTESERLALSIRGFPGKLFERDPSLFTDDEATRAHVRALLGWVSLPQEMVDKVPEITAFVGLVREARLKDAVLLFDAEQEAAASLCRAFGSSGMRMHVFCAREASLDRIEEVARLDSTLVLVCSSGRQVGQELLAVERQLWTRVLDLRQGDAQKTGKQFVAVTTPDAGLAQLARDHSYAKTFADSSHAVGAFGALGFAGLVPAALAGLDPARMVAAAKSMAEACQGQRLEDNPGASLGVLLGSMSKHGRSKLTVLASRSLEPLVQWISALISQTARQQGPGISILSGAPSQASYPPDRIFVHFQFPDDPSAIAQESMEALHIAGHPYIQIVVADRLELAAEIFRWQVAAVVAALVLGTNPFPPTRSGPRDDFGHASA